MATKKTIIELTLVGGEKVKVDLDQIGEKGQRALKRILDSGKPVPGALKAVDTAARELRSGVDNLAARLGPLGSVLKALGPAGLAAAGAVGAAGGLFIVAKRAIDTASALQDTSDRIGVNVEALQELQFAASQSGVAQETLAASLGIFSQRVGEAKNGTGALVSALKDHDRQLLEAIRNTSSMEEALDLAFAALAKEEDAAKKAALATALFGRSGRELIPIVKDGAAGLQALRDRAVELGLVLDDQVVANAEQAGDQLDTLSQVISVNLTAALLNFAPMIGAFSQSLVDASAAARAFFTIDAPNTTAEKIAEINAEIVRLSEQRAKTQGIPIFTESQEELTAQINALKEQRALLEQLAAKQKPAKGEAPAPLGPTVEEIESQKKAAKEFLSDQKSIAEELKKLHEDAATAELEGIEKIQAARDQEIAKYQEALDQKLISEEQFAQARTDLETKAQAEITKIQEEEQKKRETAQQKLEETIRESEQEVTEAVADESEKRRIEFENETEDRLIQLREQALAAGRTEEEITAILAGERERRKTIWEAQVEDASNASSAIGDAFEDMIAGIALGTQELDFGGITDAFKAAIADTIKEKLGFDKLFRGNIIDLVGDVADILTGNGGLADIFSGAFEGALTGKSGAEGGFLNQLGNLVGLAGGAGATAGGLSWGGLVGGASGVGGAGTGVLLSTAGPTAAELGALGAVGGPGTGVLAAEAGAQAGAAGAGSSAGTLGAAGWGALFAAAAIIGDNIGKKLSESSSPEIAATGRATNEFLIPEDAELAFAGKGVESLQATANGLLTGGPAINGILKAIGFDPVSAVFGEPTKGTLFRSGMDGELQRIFESLHLIMGQFDEAEEKFPELFESALPPLRAVATAIAEMADTPLKTADEVSQIVNILVNSMAAEGRGAEEAVDLAREAMEQLGISAEDAGKLAVDALEAGAISAEEFEQVIRGLAEIAGVPFEVMRDAILATIGDAEELARVLAALGEGGRIKLPDGSFAGDPSSRGGTGTRPEDFNPGDRYTYDDSGNRVPVSRGLGGYVPGPSGAETIIRAHGGEMVVPLHDRAAMRAWAARYGAGGNMDGVVAKLDALELTMVNLLSSIDRKSGRTILAPVVRDTDLPQALNRLEREKQYVRNPAPQGTPGIRS